MIFSCFKKLGPNREDQVLKSFMMRLSWLYVRGDLESMLAAHLMLKAVESDWVLITKLGVTIPGVLSQQGFPIAARKSFAHLTTGDFAWDAASPIDEDKKGLRKLPLQSIVSRVVLAGVRESMKRMELGSGVSPSALRFVGSAGGGVRVEGGQMHSANDQALAEHRTNNPKDPVVIVCEKCKTKVRLDRVGTKFVKAKCPICKSFL